MSIHLIHMASTYTRKQIIYRFERNEKIRCHCLLHKGYKLIGDLGYCVLLGHNILDNFFGNEVGLGQNADKFGIKLVWSNAACHNA